MRNLIFLSLLLLAACTSRPEEEKTATAIMQTDFGTTTDGQNASLFTLRNASGMEVKITNYGGIITSILAPDKEGKMEDIVLGFDSLAPYLQEHPYFGALIGRYGNRIAKGKFELDGKVYTLATNNIGNHLHGGLKGFDKVLWNAETATDSAGEKLVLRYRSPDGEEGYPGNLDVTVTYRLSDDNELHVDYEAVTDQPTIVNLTNHAYFNLTGNARRDILAHEVQINADRFIPVDSTLIPTGELRQVEGTPFDFKSTNPVGARINTEDNEQIKNGGGYDHAWVLNKTAEGELSPAARVLDPQSGRTLELLTTEPAVQFYTGNFLNGSLTGKGGVKYEYRYALCLEPEHYPDSPNRPEFPSTVLRPGETYRSKSVYRFGVSQ